MTSWRGNRKIHLFYRYCSIRLCICDHGSRKDLFQGDRNVQKFASQTKFMLFQDICMLAVSFRSTDGITQTPSGILILDGGVAYAYPLLGRASMSVINDTGSYSVLNGGHYLGSTCVRSWLCSTNQKWLEDNVLVNFRATPWTRLDEIWRSNKVIMPTRRPLPSTDTRCLRTSMRIKDFEVRHPRCVIQIPLDGSYIVYCTAPPPNLFHWMYNLMITC
jgi:hypothetical protein